MDVDLPEVHAHVARRDAPHRRRGRAPTSGSSRRCATTGRCASSSTTSSPATTGRSSSRGGKTIEEVGDRLDGDVLGTDPLRAYDDSSIVAAAVFREPGAMERPCAVSYGPVPGSVYCGHRFIDVLIHGWDVAEVDRAGHHARRRAGGGVLGGGRAAARRARAAAARSARRRRCPTTPTRRPGSSHALGRRG